MGSGRSLRRLGQATGKILEETTMAESASIMELHAATIAKVAKRAQVA